MVFLVEDDVAFLNNSARRTTSTGRVRDANAFGGAAEGVLQTGIAVWKE
jgi:hypothetical protein